MNVFRNVILAFVAGNIVAHLALGAGIDLYRAVMFSLQGSGLGWMYLATVFAAFVAILGKLR
jgi:hypothetical protein